MIPIRSCSVCILVMKRYFYVFSILNETTIDSASRSKTDLPQSKLKSILSSAGDQCTDREYIQINSDKNNDKPSLNQKHSTNILNSSIESGSFSLKSPIDSFRTWVSNRKSPKDDSTITTVNRSVTKYGKIETSPTPRKLSLGSDTTKRARTNSASVTTALPVINDCYHRDQQRQTQSNSASTTSSTLLKKRSSFTLRNTNPISLLKRTSEANHHQKDSPLTEQAGGGEGPFGYLKNLVRGDSSSSSKK